MAQDKRDEKSTVTKRIWAVAILIALAAGAIVLQLASLQLRNGDAYAAESENKTRRTLAVKAARGKILDRNGIALAFDQASYDVTFYRDPSHTSDAYRAAYTRAISDVIGIIEAGGGATIGGFALVPDPEGGWMFDFKTSDPDVFAEREELWRGNMGRQNEPIDEIYGILCANYGIDPEMPYAEAAKILAVWQESRNLAFLSQAVVVAKNVPFGMMAEIKARAPELLGIDIVDGNTRIYPMGPLAAHIIGYESAIPDSRIEEFTGNGYAHNDLVGVSGIESSMEGQLTGNSLQRQGVRLIEVNARGKEIRELDYDPPASGNHIKLTIDAQLQNVVETALKNAIEGPIRTAQEEYIEKIRTENPQRYESIEAIVNAREVPGIRFAKTGAAVVMDVHTGKVLAMASYPSYDLNIFSGGVDAEAYRQLLEDERLPLFHRAINGRYPPGSIFKMVTGIGALMDGVITPEEEIDDAGYYTKYESNTRYAPTCWTHPRLYRHAAQNIRLATSNSCNYYFYTVSDRMGIDSLYDWSAKFGLTTKTGIELPGEATGIVSSPSMLWDPEKPVSQQGTSKPVIARQNITAILRAAGDAIGVAYDEERIDRAVEQLMRGVEPNISVSSDLVPRIRTVLTEDLGLTGDAISSLNMVNRISDNLREIRWNNNEAILTGIGQSITNLTPIAVARYISAIANGGTVYEAQIIDAILAPDGTPITQKEPVVVRSLGDDPRFGEMLEYIHQGMRGVLSEEDQGTASPYFADFEYRDIIGAKTGTAQVNETVEIENDGWFVSYLPYEAPEIAIVIVVENGYMGGLASFPSKDIISYYMKQKDQISGTTLPQDWTWTE